MQRTKPVAYVEELLSDDCLVFSCSRGTRNVQEDNNLYIDDEIISGSIIVNSEELILPVEGLRLEESDEIFTILQIKGVHIPKELLVGLFYNDLPDTDELEAGGN